MKASIFVVGLAILLAGTTAIGGCSKQAAPVAPAAVAAPEMSDDAALAEWGAEHGLNLTVYVAREQVKIAGIGGVLPPIDVNAANPQTYDRVKSKLDEVKAQYPQGSLVGVVYENGQPQNAELEKRIVSAGYRIVRPKAVLPNSFLAKVLETVK